MIFTYKKALSDFNFWGQAQTNAQKLTSAELDRIEAKLSILNEGQPQDQTSINDLFAFDFGFVCSLIGKTEEEIDERAQNDR